MELQLIKERYNYLLEQKEHLFNEAKHRKRTAQPYVHIFAELEDVQHELLRLDDMRTFFVTGVSSYTRNPNYMADLVIQLKQDNEHLSNQSQALRTKIADQYKLISKLEDEIADMNKKLLRIRLYKSNGFPLRLEDKT